MSTCFCGEIRKTVHIYALLSGAMWLGFQFMLTQSQPMPMPRKILLDFFSSLLLSLKVTTLLPVDIGKLLQQNHFVTNEQIITSFITILP